MSLVMGQNRKQLIVVSALLVLLLTVSGKADAGVGMLEQGEQLVSADLNFDAANEHWDVTRNVITNVCKARNTGLTLGYEYGWSYYHTVYANAGLAQRRCGQTTVAGGGVVVSGQATGLADVELGVRTRFGGNYLNNAAWEAFMIIPTGYDNNSPSALGKGTLGAGLGVIFASHPKDKFPYRTWGVNAKKWGWKVGSKFTYYFSSKGNSLRSYAAIQYAFTDSDFERTGDFLDLRIINSIGFANNGVQQQIFVNQVASSLTNSDQTSIQASYSHSFGNGWNTNIRIGKAFFGRNAPISWFTGVGISYRWRD